MTVPQILIELGRERDIREEYATNLAAAKAKRTEILDACCADSGLTKQGLAELDRQVLAEMVKKHSGYVVDPVVLDGYVKEYVAAK
jgi:hypothetical protein